MPRDIRDVDSKRRASDGVIKQSAQAVTPYDSGAATAPSLRRAHAVIGTRRNLDAHAWKERGGCCAAIGSACIAVRRACRFAPRRPESPSVQHDLLRNQRPTFTSRGGFGGCRATDRRCSGSTGDDGTALPHRAPHVGWRLPTSLSACACTTSPVVCACVCLFPHTQCRTGVFRVCIERRAAVCARSAVPTSVVERGAAAEPAYHISSIPCPPHPAACSHVQL